MSDVPIEAVTTFDRVIKLISAVIWPLFLAICLLIFRDSIRRALRALVALAERADEVKIGQLEIRRTVEQIAQTVTREENPVNVSSIPATQSAAAREIRDIVSTAHNSRARDALRQSVRRRMLAFASKYEKLLGAMPAGPERTSEMNVVTAQMRSLGLAARRFLPEFSASSEFPGMRLAAIAILQVSPSSDYLMWLFQRFENEQPFIFFQASVAILQAVRKYGSRRTVSLSTRLENSIKQIESYEGGPPDQSTLHVLHTALEELKQMHPTKNL